MVASPVAGCTSVVDEIVSRVSIVRRQDVLSGEMRFRSLWIAQATSSRHSITSDEYVG